MDPKKTSIDECPAKKHKRRVALEPEAYRDQMKLCPKCGANGEDIKFKYCNNKKESQARYQCTKCKHKFMFRYQRRSHPNGYAKAHQRQQRTPTPDIAINYEQPITSPSPNEISYIEQGDQLQRACNLAAQDNPIVEQFSNGPRWNDLPAHDGFPDFAQGHRSRYNIVNGSVVDMHSSTTLPTFMGSLVHGGISYEQVDQQSLCNIGAIGISDDGQSLDPRQCILSTQDTLFGGEQADQQSLCNIGANDIFDDGKSLDPRQCNLFAQDTLFGGEQVDQQSLCNIGANNILDDGRSLDPKQRILSAQDTLFGGEQVDHQSLCNVGVNDISENGRSLVSKQYSVSTYETPFDFEQGHQQSLCNIFDESINEEQLPEIMWPLGSPTHFETPYWQVDEQTLRNISANDIFDDERFSDSEEWNLFGHGEVLQSY